MTVRMHEYIEAGRQMLRDGTNRLVNREEGQDMIEYALLAALIAIAAIAVIVLVGPQLRLLFQDVVNALQSTG